MAGVTFLLGSAVLALPEPRGDHTKGEVLAVDTAVGFAIFAVASTLTLRRVQRDFQVMTSRRALTYPWRRAAEASIAWLAAAIVIGTLDVRFYKWSFEIVEIVWGILLPGVVASSLTFFLVERALQPLLPDALERDEQARHHRVTVLLRLVTSWLLGSGVWFVIIFLAPLGRGEHERADLAPYLWFVCFMGIGAGLVMNVVVARSLGGRLRELRRAQQRVHEGDLDVAVTVDDAGELGLLQAGFNEMVVGLRERRRVEQLFGTYVGPEAARYAIDHEVDATGELRQVSVMFVDVVDSTGLAQRGAPDRLVSMLNDLFESVVHVVADEAGWIDKFEGDAALCVFGAPVDQADHATRALCCARELRRQTARLAAMWPGLDVGIGVSTGEVVAGHVGARERHEYTVIGDPVHEAARLSEVAKLRPARVLASSSAVACADREASHWVDVGEIALRGRSRPARAYEPLGIR